MDKNLYELAFNYIVTQTEKAICLNVMVSWNSKCYDKNVWFPKSVCEIREAPYDKKNGKRAFISQWMIEQKEKSHPFHGYDMKFETIFN